MNFPPLNVREDSDTDISHVEYTSPGILSSKNPPSQKTISPTNKGPFLRPLLLTVHPSHSDFYKGERCHVRAGLLGSKSGSPKQIFLGRAGPSTIRKDWYNSSTGAAGGSTYTPQRFL